MLLLQIDHGWDRFLTIALGGFGTLMSILAWFFKRKIEVYDKHLDECNKRAIVTAQLESNVKNLSEKADRTEKTVIWVGNCMTRIGTKMGVELPDRES